VSRVTSPGSLCRALPAEKDRPRVLSLSFNDALGIDAAVEKFVDGGRPDAIGHGDV
jgi:hypothetical protein